MTRLVTAADLCHGMQTVLEAELPALVEAFTLDEVLKPVKTWDQLPTLEAITAANMPAGAITSPGLASTPVTRGASTDATWRIVAGVYDRDGDHSTTSHRIRIWAGLIRAAVLRRPSLGGIAQTTTWVGEEYALIRARSAAQTLGGCAVAFDVTATNVVDVFDLIELPLVESTHPILTVRPN